ncbi:hypothetical protein BBJ28_00014028 [Nothophytophthora sp. Chile5]|nr:hypothetical protein BBJ28_00014028 [Nothophytophthora sp. Chile5]
MSISTVNSAVERLSEDEVRAVLRGWKDLSDSDVDLYVASGVGKSLIALERSGFQCSEGDPLLLLCPVLDKYDASMAYLDGGNYAIPAGIPGHQPWPGGAPPDRGDELPVGVDARPPRALGRFIAQRFPEAVDVTLGVDMNVFSLKHLCALFEIDYAVRSSPQFVRCSSASHKDPEDSSLVRAVILDEVTGRPQKWPMFTVPYC